MCNLYNQTTAQVAMRQLFAGLEWSAGTGNLEPGEIYPDRLGPIIRHAANGLELARLSSRATLRADVSGADRRASHRRERAGAGRPPTTANPRQLARNSAKAR